MDLASLLIKHNLEHLKDRFMKEKVQKKRKSDTTTRKVTVGIKVKQVKQKKYFQKRGDTHSINERCNVPLADLLPTCLEYFFPSGISEEYGNLDRFNFFLGRFDGTEVDTTKMLMEEFGLSGRLVRLYLHLEEKEEVSVVGQTPAPATATAQETPEASEVIPRTKFTFTDNDDEVAGIQSIGNTCSVSVALAMIQHMEEFIYLDSNVGDLITKIITGGKEVSSDIRSLMSMCGISTGPQDVAEVLTMILDAVLDKYMFIKEICELEGMEELTYTLCVKGKQIHSYHTAPLFCKPCTGSYEDCLRETLRNGSLTAGRGESVLAPLPKTLMLSVSQGEDGEEVPFLSEELDADVIEEGSNFKYRLAGFVLYNKDHAPQGHFRFFSRLANRSWICHDGANVFERKGSVDKISLGNIPVIAVYTASGHMSRKTAIVLETPASVDVSSDDSDDAEIIHDFLAQENVSQLPGKDVSDMMQSVETKLQEIIGLDSLKAQLRSFAQECVMDAFRKSLGLRVAIKRPSMLFIGNPGTGKTSVAGIVAEIMHLSGLVSNGTLHTVQREGLVAEHIGETAMKTQTAINGASGSTLLIDEAYRLTQAESNKDFGQEALDTIMGCMEGGPETTSNRPALIFAGYPTEMELFKNANRGLQRRITHVFNFQDYNPSELAGIFVKMCKDANYSVETSKDEIEAMIKQHTTAEDLSKVNAGYCTNLLMTVKKHQNKRLFKQFSTKSGRVEKDKLMVFTRDDIGNAVRSAQK